MDASVTGCRGWLAGGAVAVALVVVAGGCTPVASGGGEFRDPDEPPRPVTAEDVGRRIIDTNDMRRHVAFLASDELRGRATPSPGLRRAGSWTAQQLQLAGLDPAGDDGGYVQYWSAGADTVAAPNVIGVLPGSDLTRSGEYVVLVAHLDHLGVGEPGEDGDSIYNGADDNATGVAALVEIAHAFAALPDRPARPVAFLAVSGRERGVGGSSWYLEHPTLDLSRAVAVLNIDMIGRNDPESVAVLDQDAPELGALIADVARETPALRLTVVRDPPGDSMPPAPTDHAPFAAAGIPAATVSTGLHEDAHRPSDEARRVDADKATRVARLVFLTAHALATSTLR